MTFKKIAVAVAAAVFAAAPAHAGQKTPGEITSEITSSFPDNVVGAITASKLRTVTQDIADSFAPLSSIVAACSSSKWISQISTGGVPVCTRPAFSDLSGALSASQIPAPTLTSFGGVLAINATTSRFLTSLSTGGVFSAAQPAFSDISGVIAAAQLVAPAGGSALGAVKSSSAPTNQFATGIDTTGAVTYAQPAFSDLSGAIAASQLIAPAGGSALGAVKSSTAGSHQFATGIDTTGAVTYAQPAFSDLSGSVAASQLPALTGDVSSSAGSASVTVNKVQGTSPGTGVVTAFGTALDATGGFASFTRSMQHVATNAALAAASTTDYPNGVIRDNVSAGSHSTPLPFVTSTSLGGTTCASLGLTNDVGSCVTSADGKAWVARYASDEMDAEQFGVLADGSTDNLTALTAAATAAAARKYTLVLPCGGVMLSSSTVAFGAIAVRGGCAAQMAAVPAGAYIKCPDALAAACVTIGTSGSNLGGRMDNVIVGFTTTPVAGDIGIIAYGTTGLMHNVMVYNAYDGYDFSGAAQHADFLYTGVISHDHIVMRKPELYITHARFGVNGTYDVAGRSYIYVTGADPNTLVCTACQMNLGQHEVNYIIYFGSMSSQNNGIYKISDSYIEAVDTAVIGGDGTGGCYRCTFSNNTISLKVGGAGVLQSFASTPTLQTELASAKFIGTQFWNLTFNYPTGQADVDITNVSTIGNCTFSGGSSLNVEGFRCGGTMALSGAWTLLNISNVYSTGAYTDTATGSIRGSNVPSLSWTPTVLFGGSATTLTSSTGLASRLPDGTVKFKFGALLSAVSTSGAATIGGLPYTCGSWAYGGEYGGMIYATNMSGLTSPVLAFGAPGTATAVLDNTTTTGMQQLSHTNFSATSRLGGTFVCKPQ